MHSRGFLICPMDSPWNLWVLPKDRLLPGVPVLVDPMSQSLLLSVVWNPGMDRRPVLHMLVLFSLLWGHSGVFQGPRPVSDCQ